METPAIGKTRDIWFISDTHFFHHNIIKYCDRPFSSVEEMNEHMLDKWNSVVKPGDKVYHLGDVLMGPVSPGHFESFWSRLNGSKRLVVGNHDDIKYLSAGGFFQKVMMWRHFKDHNILLTHVPIHESSIHERIVVNGGVNVHGHTHEKGSPKGPYKSVCVERVNYTPIHIEEVNK
jgi:calcineurin-like phosphoesterase family protein